MKTTKQYITQTEKYVAHNYHPLPVVLTKGNGVWVWDTDGKKYIDMLGAYSAVSHGHINPTIKKAAIEQMNRLTLPSRGFHNDRLGEFAERLAKLTKKDKILPMNTGSEAVETALKAARKWGHKIKKIPENKAEIITCRGNFHGRTISIVSFSTQSQYQDGFGPFTPGFHPVTFGDIEALRRAITSNTVGFLFEPIQAEGGICVPPDGYLKDAYELCKKNNILFIADEIQTGLYRTGKLFACDYEKIIPDIYILGKGLGGGFYPVSAIAANDEIMNVFTPGDHGSTFGGNPLAAAIGLAALDVFANEKLAEKAYVLGEYFRDQLRSIKSPYVKEVRGKGLLIGVEIKKSSGKAMDFCVKLMREGVLTKDTQEQVMRFAPPLVISKKELDWALEKIKKVLAH